jgi:oxygen-independent coproporphyrinogen-3 oxidase
MNHCAVPTIFFGGGTPSLMPVNIFAEITGALRDSFYIAPDAEITLESNPGTLDSVRLREFMTHGVNRLSVGVQSFNDSDLKFLGRRHSVTDAVKLIKIAQDFGLCVSGDFIYALPHHRINDVEKMCHDILDLELRHASIYELSIEPGTPLAKRGVKKIDNELSAEMYEIIGNVLSDKLPRYEISNYADPFNICRHNQNIWAGDPYIGFGPSACGRPFINDIWHEQENKAWALESDVKILDNETRAAEKIITGLRTRQGVDLTPDVRNVIDWDFVKRNPDMFVDGKNLSLSVKGLLLLDNLLIKLIK